MVLMHRSLTQASRRRYDDDPTGNYVDVPITASENHRHQKVENIYWEYHFGIGNIFKLLRVDFEYRGSYRDAPGATNFAVKVGLGFYF